MPTVKEIIDTGFNYHQDGNLVDAENAYKQALLMDEENSDLCNLMGVLKLCFKRIYAVISLIK